MGTARRQTGTQYTPRTLTESVVQHALEPLVYNGPAEGEPPEAWRLKSADQILDLKICDFACGSAAFLVAAGRYVSARLVEAWEVAQKEHGANVQITPYGHKSCGLPEEELIPGNPDERGLYALRIVVERCLYGVDRNPLAVEMAKLSLWLLTLQRSRPFTFLDHSIRCGDSLLGVDLKQLSTWSLSGEGKQRVLFQDDLSFAASKREGLMKMMYRTNDQKRMLDAALEKTRRLRAAADRLIATAFEANFEAAAAAITFGLEEQEEEAQKILEGNRPFHWPVEFPEVFMHNGGFDAIVGNPPYIGGQRITGALGTPYRDYLIEFIADGKRGSADYVAYFFLRAFGLLKDGGTAGLLATNTVAQGDTREVGLDQMAVRGAVIFRAIASRKWPGEANLDVAHVWLRKGLWKGPYLIDDLPAKAITTQLHAPGNVIGKPFGLGANAKKSFQGSIVLGMGFVLDPERAQGLLQKDPRNGDVLCPYLKGEDLTERWDLSPSRWVINFHDWPIEKAKEYEGCFEIIERTVKPIRAKNNRKVYRDKWWQYAEKRPDLYTTVSGLGRVIVAVRVCTHHTIAFAPGGIVYSDRLAVIATDRAAHFALLASTIHDAWAHRPGSTTHETRNTYFPERSFETFPFPGPIDSIEEIGEAYHQFRLDLMAARREGLTNTYNRFHSPHEVSPDIARLRELHSRMDLAIASAYGWTELDLGHGFHETRQGVRYTISEIARRKLIDRLLALNHERYAQEQADLLSAPKPKSKYRKRAPQQAGLF